MTRPMRLGVRTATYQELIGNGRTYHVPPYQRDYSWRREQWEDLWNDLIEMRNGGDPRHYMGSLVLEDRSDQSFVIIDGQQRLATLAILTLAVIDALSEMAASGLDPAENRDRAAEMRSRFIGKKSLGSLIESSRLHLNETDDGFYQDYLVQLRKPRNPRALPESNRLLWNCFLYFGHRIRGQQPFSADGAALGDLIEHIVARRLTFIQITVDDDLNAYMLFETLDARGVDLTTTDLLKNYIFSRASSADRSPMLRRWHRIAATVGQKRVPTLLRYHMLCEVPKVRSRRLFKLVRDRYRSAREVYGLVETLQSRADLFAAVGDPLHEYWMDLPDARPHIAELRTFGVTQMMPLLFEAWDHWPKRNFVRVLRLVCVLTFRYTVVSRMNPNDLESAYHLAAKAVREGTATTPSRLFEVLKHIYVPDERTKTDFAFLSIPARGPRKKLVKHLLARLETDASGRHCDPDTDPGTIEHIFPENADYAEKVRVYGSSRYALTSELTGTAPEEWTPALLHARQLRLAGRAVHLWRADFE